MGLKCIYSSKICTLFIISGIFRNLPIENFALNPLCVTLVSVRNRSRMEEPVECWVEGLVLPHSLEIKFALNIEPSLTSK